jgi:Adenylate kinase, active site lid
MCIVVHAHVAICQAIAPRARHSTADVAVMTLLAQLKLCKQLRTRCTDFVYIRAYCDRQLHSRSGRVYVSSDNPPKVPGRDDVTGEHLLSLNDERLYSVFYKMLRYHLTTGRVLSLYQQRQLVQSFTGVRSDAVYADMRAYLRAQLPHLAATGRNHRVHSQKEDDRYNRCSDFMFYGSDDRNDEHHTASSTAHSRASADEQPLEQQQPFQALRAAVSRATVSKTAVSRAVHKCSVSDGWTQRAPGSAEEVWDEPGSSFWTKTDSNLTKTDSKASTRGTGESGDRAVERTSLFSWGAFSWASGSKSADSANTSRDDSSSSGGYRSSSHSSNHDNDSDNSSSKSGSDFSSCDGGSG